MRPLVTKFLFHIFSFFHQVRFIEKAYWNHIHGFRPASHCAPEMLDKTFRYARTLKTLGKGDYFEFGVFKGYCVWFAQQLAGKYGAPAMQFFGFDSFTGLPKPVGVDNLGYFYEGQYAYPRKRVIENIQKHGGNMQPIKLIGGYYEDSLRNHIQKKNNMKKVTIAYIDCDLYASTTVVLEFLKDLLMENSLIVFDDWNAFSRNEDKGEPLAFTEFMKKYPHIKFRKEFSYCWHGQVFRVERIG